MVPPSLDLSDLIPSFILRNGWKKWTVPVSGADPEIFERRGSKVLFRKYRYVYTLEPK